MGQVGVLFLLAFYLTFELYNFLAFGNHCRKPSGWKKNQIPFEGRGLMAAWSDLLGPAKFGHPCWLSRGRGGRGGLAGTGEKAEDHELVEIIGGYLAGR